MVSNLFGYEDTLCGVCRGFGATVAECKHATHPSQGWDIAIPANVVWGGDRKGTSALPGRRRS